ncbi:MAG: 4Fe-4S dicluster domain-containing protein [Candidatus Geothermincolia bacterium]
MLAHVVAGEQSQPRLWLLKLYARREVGLLRIFHRLLQSRIMRSRLAATVIYWTLAYPSARWGIVGTPVSPGELSEFFESASRVAVGPCRCRLAHGACGHPIETDIVVRTGFPVWTGLFPEDYREITAAAAIDICTDSHGRGMAQIAYAHLDAGDGGSYFVMCNCCSDGCLPLLAMRFYGGARYPMHRGKLRAFVEDGRCQGCGKCVDACVFGARSLKADGLAAVNGCYGCGLCVTFCPSGASALV